MRNHIVSLGIIVFVVAAVLVAGCAWTMSSERQKRISDCLAQCGPAQGPQRGGPLDPPDSNRDLRTECERRCHQQ